MPNFPDLSPLLGLLNDKCGPVYALGVIIVVWLVKQLANARAVGESDRASYMKLYNEQTTTINALQSKVELLVFAIQNRNVGHDN